MHEMWFIESLSVASLWLRIGFGDHSLPLKSNQVFLLHLHSRTFLYLKCSVFTKKDGPLIRKRQNFCARMPLKVVKQKQPSKHAAAWSLVASGRFSSEEFGWNVSLNGPWSRVSHNTSPWISLDNGSISVANPFKVRPPGLFTAGCLLLCDLTAQTGGSQLRETRLKMSARTPGSPPPALLPRQGKAPLNYVGGKFPAVATGYGSRGRREGDGGGRHQMDLSGVHQA